MDNIYKIQFSNGDEFSGHILNQNKINSNIQSNLNGNGIYKTQNPASQFEGSIENNLFKEGTRTVINKQILFYKNFNIEKLHANNLTQKSINEEQIKFCQGKIIIPDTIEIIVDKNLRQIGRKNVMEMTCIGEIQQHNNESHTNQNLQQSGYIFKLKPEGLGKLYTNKYLIEGEFFDGKPFGLVKVFRNKLISHSDQMTNSNFKSLDVNELIFEGTLRNDQFQDKGIFYTDSSKFEISLINSKLNDSAKLTLEENESSKSRQIVDMNFKSNNIQENIVIKQFSGVDIDFKSSMKFRDADLNICTQNQTNQNKGYYQINGQEYTLSEDGIKKVADKSKQLFSQENCHTSINYKLAKEGSLQEWSQTSPEVMVKSQASLHKDRSVYLEGDANIHQFEKGVKVADVQAMMVQSKRHGKSSIDIEGKQSWKGKFLMDNELVQESVFNYSYV